jgi:hypothetical protein
MMANVCRFALMLMVLGCSTAYVHAEKPTLEGRWILIPQAGTEIDLYGTLTLEFKLREEGLNARRPYFLLMHVREYSNVQRVKSIIDKLGPEFELVPLDVFIRMAGEAPTFKERFLR